MEITEENTLPGIAEAANSLEPAPVLARSLAAFVDYLVVYCMLLLSSASIQFEDFAVFLSFLIGLLYFSVSDSHFGAGQSLGKKLFGVRVISLKKESGSVPLGIWQSAYRFFWAFGLLLLVAEIPPLIYRSSEFIAEPMLLELHMLPVQCYSFCNILLLLFSSTHMAIHDRISQSIVVRATTASPAELEPLAGKFVQDNPTWSLAESNVLPALGAGLIGGALFWGLGVFHPPQVQAIHSQRFVLEHQLPIRIIDISANKNHVTISALVTNAESANTQEQEVTTSNAELVAKRAKQLLASSAQAAGITSLEFLFYGPGVDGETGPKKVTLELGK